MSIKEESLMKALDAAACTELPKAFVENGEDFWIEGIALVRKRNGTQSYCLVSHREDGMVMYDRDFGMMSPIFGLVSVHPYIMLDKEKYYPKGSRSSVAFRIVGEYSGVTEDELKEMSDEKFRQACLRYAIDHQKDEVARLARENKYVDDNDSPDLSPKVASYEDVQGTTVITDGGVLEQFTPVASYAEAKKRGRKPNPKK